MDRCTYPEDVHPYILELMKKFELCYELKGRESILVPDLLPVAEPAHDIDQVRAHKLRIRYDFLPKTVMPRLIVRRHEEIEGELRWRNGVVFHNQRFGSRALIRADYENGAILGWITGGGVHQYLIVLLDALGEINHGFKETKIVEEVACVCKVCIDQIEPEFHPLYPNLRLYLKGIRTTNCYQSEEVVPIAELLGHALTGDAANFELLLDEINQVKHKLMELKLDQRKEKLGRIVMNTIGITGFNVDWLAKGLDIW